MDSKFFEQPILNSPYAYPGRHWELDAYGQPTGHIVDRRRSADFITPIPKSKKQKKAKQESFVFDEGQGLSTEKQQYELTELINALRQQVDRWRQIPNPEAWGVTPETQRLLQYWRSHEFSNLRPFF